MAPHNAFEVIYSNVDIDVCARFLCTLQKFHHELAKSDLSIEGLILLLRERQFQVRNFIDATINFSADQPDSPVQHIAISWLSTSSLFVVEIKRLLDRSHTIQSNSMKSIWNSLENFLDI